MSKINSLCTVLNGIESGETIADALSRVLSDVPSTIALQVWLDSTLRHLSSMNLIGTASEQAVMDMLDNAPGGELMLSDVQAQADTYNLPSLGSRSHASRAVNDLATLGLVGKWRVSKGPGRPLTHFGQPERAVLNALTRIDVMPSEVDDEVMLELSSVTGMPLVKIVKLLKSLRL